MAGSRGHGQVSWNQLVNEYHIFNTFYMDEYSSQSLYGVRPVIILDPMASEKLLQKLPDQDRNIWDVHYTDPYAGVECVFPDSDIQVSNSGDTIKAKDIKEGDSIMYYNMNTKQVEEGTVSKVYIHKNANSFVKYTFEDGTYLKVTDYHPIYTKEGWKSYTRRNGYELPKVGDEVKTSSGWKKLSNIEAFTGLEDCYDFSITGASGEKVNNYFANNTLVESSL